MDNALEEWFNLHKFHFYTGSYETKDLANFLHISPRTLQRWLKEKSKPSEEQAAKIKLYLAEKGKRDSL